MGEDPAMIRSMTAFASTDESRDFGRLAWEVRSVNHRYLEISLRLPEEFRPLEAAFRECVTQHVKRGKIDATLRFHPSGKFAGARLGLNRDLAETLLQLHRELADATDNPQTPNLLNLMRWPGVIDEQTGDLQEVQAASVELMREAVQKLLAMRGREGSKLADMIKQRLAAVSHWVGHTRELLPEIREQHRQKLLDKIAQLEQPLDDGRLEQEITFLAQKMDVDEELDRLHAHIEETYRVLQLDEPVGRRLDFLMQEFNREANTLGSKSIDSRTTKVGVELKVLIEQMREQIQNVE